MIGLRALTAEELRASPLRWWTLGTLSLSLVIIGMDNTVLNVAIPTLQREFDASASILQWMVDSYILVFAGLLLTMGSLGDRHGRAMMLRLGLIVFSAAAFSAIFAESAGHVIAARAGMGVGGAMIMPSTLSIITDVFVVGPERAKAIAIWAAVGGIGVGLGPLVGGALIETFSWEAVFLINVPFTLAALALGVRLVPESKDAVPRRLDVPGAVLSTASVAILVFAIIEAPELGWTAPLVIAGFAASVALAIVFAVYELRTPHPLFDFRFLRRFRFSAGAASLGCAFFALFGMAFGMTQYLQFVKGFSPLEAGMAMLPIAAGVAIGSRAGERLNERIGTKRTVALGLLMLAGALSVINVYDVDTPYAVIGAVILSIAASMGLIMAPSTNAVMGAVPRADAGVGSAMNDVVRQVGGALGVAVIGSIFASLYSSNVSDTLDGIAGLPPGQVAAAGDSVGAAVRIAGSLDGPAGAALDLASRAAFADALGYAILAGSGIAVFGALLVAKFMPAREQYYPEDTAKPPRPPSPD